MFRRLFENFLCQKSDHHRRLPKIKMVINNEHPLKSMYCIYARLVATEHVHYSSTGNASIYSYIPIMQAYCLQWYNVQFETFNQREMQRNTSMFVQMLEIYQCVVNWLHINVFFQFEIQSTFYIYDKSNQIYTKHIG